MKRNIMVILKKQFGLRFACSKCIVELQKKGLFPSPEDDSECVSDEEDDSECVSLEPTFNKIIIQPKIGK